MLSSWTKSSFYDKANWSNDSSKCTLNSKKKKGRKERKRTPSLHSDPSPHAMYSMDYHVSLMHAESSYCAPIQRMRQPPTRFKQTGSVGHLLHYLKLASTNCLYVTINLCSFSARDDYFCGLISQLIPT